MQKMHIQSCTGHSARDEKKCGEESVEAAREKRERGSEGGETFLLPSDRSMHTCIHHHVTCVIHTSLRRSFAFILHEHCFSSEKTFTLASLCHMN